MRARSVHRARALIIRFAAAVRCWPRARAVHAGVLDLRSRDGKGGGLVECVWWM